MVAALIADGVVVTAGGRVLSVTATAATLPAARAQAYAAVGNGLAVLGTSYARLSFTQPSKPAVLRGQAELDGPADDAYRYVLMPVRLAG